VISRLPEKVRHNIQYAALIVDASVGDDKMLRFAKRRFEME